MPPLGKSNERNAAGIGDQAESVSSDQVASQILAVQTALQAS